MNQHKATIISDVVRLQWDEAYRAAKKGVDLYNACSRWSDFGELNVIPLVDVSDF